MNDLLNAPGTVMINRTMRWITYKGHQVLVGDFRGMGGPDFVKAIDEARSGTLALHAAPGSLLSVNLVAGAVVDKQVLEAFKNHGRSSAPFVKKTAVVGVEGVQKFFLHIVCTFSSLDIKPFDALETALDWLVERT